MARIKDSSVDAVKSAAEILPLVEHYVRLRKAGGTYKGLCPFHQERTPSFTVTPARGTYKCFGCGEGGDAISFVEKLENVDFVGAIEHLAKVFGVEIEYEEISPEADRARRQKERLGQLLERATAFYERLLWESDQAGFVREYLASRGLGEDVCRQFRLGYAPGGPTLARRAAQEGFTGDELLAAGLANRRGNDYFNRRLLFPLTERQLRELNRLTKRVFLCFDADAAGQDATLRGMELAFAQGFDVQVVPLPKGTDPADDPAVFEQYLRTPVSYLVHRVRLLHERARDKSAAFTTIEEFLKSQPDSPEHLDARRLATDLLDLPPETQAALAPRGRSSASAVISPRLLDAGKRLERSALAGVAAHPKLNRYLEELGADHFDHELHRRARAHLLGKAPADDELTPLLAELYAMADREDLTEETAEQLLLRLRERRLQRQLSDAKPDHLLELQQRLAEVRTAIREFA